MIPPPMPMSSQTLPTSASNLQLHIKPPTFSDRPTTSSGSTSIVISSFVSSGVSSSIPPSSPLRHLSVVEAQQPNNPSSSAMRLGGECLQCGVQFKHRRALTAHMADCGVAAKCPFCPMVLRHRQMLVEHVETHRPGYVA